MIIYKNSIGYNIDDKIFYIQVPYLTKSIEDSYSGHIKWLLNKFFPGLEKNTRGYSFATDYNMLAGCSLLKNEPDEKKLCCLFVNPDYRGQKIASNLVQNSFELLNTDKPVMTVSEHNLSQLEPLIKRFGFELTSVKESIYKKGIKEYYYNEGLAR